MNSVDFRLFLGQASMFQDGGFLWLHEATPSAALATPSVLKVPFDRPNVEVFTNSGVIQQVKTPLLLVHVAVVDPYTYELQLFTSNNVTGSSAPYGTNGAAFEIIEIKNPDTNVANNRLWITDKRSGLADRVSQYTYSNSSTQAQRWDLLKADGQTVESKWTVPNTNSNFSTTYRQTSSGSNILSLSAKTYEYLSSVDRSVLISETEGVGVDEQTTTYTYYTTPITNMNNVLVQRIDYPDGKWVYYKYDEFGRKTFEFSTYNNNPPPASGVEPSVVTDRCKEIAYTYNDNSSSPYTTVISVPVEVSGVWQSQEVSRATHYVESHWSMDQQSVGGGNGDLTTYTYYYSDSNDSASYQRIQSISNPNGTASYYNYILTNGTFITVESSGEPDDWNQPYSIFNGKQTTTVIDGLGRTLSRVVTNIVDGIATNQLAGDTFVYSPTDLFWRDYYRYDLANRTNQYQYACCGLDSTVDPDGVVTMYSYDLLRRETGRTVLRGTNAVTFTNVLDGLGRSLDSLRIGSSSAVISSERYDSLGRVVAETNALHGATRISYSIVGNQRYVTNTYPDGGTRIEQYYRDGRLQSVSGTAVFPLQYQYGTEQDSNDGVWREYTLEIKPTATGETNEWVKTITDAAGRHFKTFYSGTASDCFAVSYYNNSIPGG
ncbi:MAG: hypothetical protein ACTHLW_21330, partial [Verrucomicrobiota bacterium]